ncbi:MAG: MmcQ/YjbR family DNA-binding protein [Actinobacteria bacterium]|nr:MmcQ/YjbR family DNA-binding protein [Actinomycetota bacterium]
MERPSNPAITELVRQRCMALPEVTERLSHGECTWFVRGKKVFVQMSDHHHDDRLGLWCAAPPGVMAELVEQEPERFFRPPYVGVKGWLGVYLDTDDVTDLDWDEIGAIVIDAYRQIAPAKLAALLDET